jgi:hypothetical protein
MSEIPPEAADLLQAIYRALRPSEDAVAIQARAALFPIVGRIHARLPVRPDDCRNAAALLSACSPAVVEAKVGKAAA